MAKELPKTYDPKQVEKRIYKEWCDKGYFHAEVDKNKKPFKNKIVAKDIPKNIMRFPPIRFLNY